MKKFWMVVMAVKLCEYTKRHTLKGRIFWCVKYISIKNPQRLIYRNYMYVHVINR